jgi:hypothetical protein
MRKEIFPVPFARLLEELSLFEKEANCDEIWTLQYEAQINFKRVP